jgi:hypothetical protein
VVAGGGRHSHFGSTVGLENLIVVHGPPIEHDDSELANTCPQIDMLSTATIDNTVINLPDMTLLLCSVVLELLRVR